MAQAGLCLSFAVWAGVGAHGEDVILNVGSTKDSPVRWLAAESNWSPERFPKADDFAVIPKANSYSAGIYLDDGDDVTVSGFSFLRNCNWATGGMTIRKGATFSVTGAETTSCIHEYSSYNDKAYLDVYGTFVFGGKELNVRPCHQNKSPTTYGTTFLTVHDGGVLNVTNGLIRMTGGLQGESSSIPQLTNVLHVAEGGKATFTNGAYLMFGAGTRDQAWASGGTLIVEDEVTFDTAKTEAIVLTTVKGAPKGGITVTGKGRLDCGGRAIYFGGLGTNVVSVSGGGVLTNAVLSYQTSSGDNWDGACQRVEMRDGTIHLNGIRFGTSTGDKTQRNHIRTIGDQGYFYTRSSSQHTPCWDDGIMAEFFDFKLAAHTPATSVNGITPIIHGTVTTESWNKFLQGRYRLSPEGGVQLVHRKTFTLQTREHLSSEPGYNYFQYIEAERPKSFGGVVGTNLWSYADAALDSSPLLGGKSAHAFNVTLRDSARLPDGVELAEPAVRGWIALPKKRTAPEWMKVCLKLVPEDGFTVADLVDEMTAAGCDAAVEATELGGVAYNVTVTVPMSEYATGSSEEAIVFDFEDVRNYYAAMNESARKVKAKVAAAKTEYARRGLTMIFR